MTKGKKGKMTKRQNYVRGRVFIADNKPVCRRPDIYIRWGTVVAGRLTSTSSVEGRGGAWWGVRGLSINVSVNDIITPGGPPTEGSHRGAPHHPHVKGPRAAVSAR